MTMELSGPGTVLIQLLRFVFYSFASAGYMDFKNRFIYLAFASALRSFVACRRVFCALHLLKIYGYSISTVCGCVCSNLYLTQIIRSVVYYLEV